MLEHLRDSMTCGGQQFDLTSDVKNELIILSARIKAEECNIVGYIEFKTLVTLDEKVHSTNILRSTPTPEMLDPEWERLYGVRLSKEGTENQTVLVKCDKNLVLERFVRQFYEPLEFNPKSLSTFTKRVNEYVQEKANKEKELKLLEAVKAMVKANPSISPDMAMEFMKAQGN